MIILLTFWVICGLIASIALLWNSWQCGGVTRSDAFGALVNFLFGPIVCLVGGAVVLTEWLHDRGHEYIIRNKKYWDDAREN